MLERIFTLSSVLFLIGITLFLLGRFLMPNWSQVTLPAGMLTMGISGCAMGVSGVFLILDAKAGT